MINREAIEILGGLKISKTDHVYVNNQALDLAIQALEKQEPEKPMGEIVERCPDCQEDNLHSELFYEEYNFCPNCGKAIDWSNNE